MEETTETSIEFGDLLAVYPDIDEEDFSGKLSAKVEFFRLKEDVEVKRGDLFPHQKVIQRFFSRVTPYESLMLFHPPGRGKTRTSLQIAKMYIDYPRKFGTDENNQKILIISKKSVLPVWPDQMKLVPEYRRDDFDKAPADSSSAKRHLTMVMSRYVDIIAQDLFANKLEQMSDDAIRKQYSRPLIIIDEAHFLRTTVESQYDENGIIVDSGKEAGGKYQNKKAYIQIRRLCQLVVGSLKIILTGTPMPDKPEELVSVTSFILPEDKQMTVQGFRQAYAAGEQVLLEYMEPKLRGMISYISEDRGTAPFIKMGERLKVSNEQGELVQYRIRIQNVVMTERQTNVYFRYHASDQQEVGEPQEHELNTETFYINSRKALNNIFIHPTDPEQDTLEMEYFFESPGSASNKNGFVEINPPKTKTAAQMKEEKDKKKERKRQKEEQAESAKTAGRKIKPSERIKITDNIPRTFAFRFRNEYDKMTIKMPDGKMKKVEEYKVLKFGESLPPARMELVRLMSAKAHYIINNVWNDWTFKGEGEVTLVYHPFVNEGGGIPLGMFFEFVGFQRFIGNENISMVSALPDVPRFAYLTGKPGATEKQLAISRNLVSSPENIYGRKLMVIIASEVVATGWTFSNLRKFFHLGPNFKLYRQARGRSNRLDSHVNFPRHDQKFVKTYLLAGVTADGEETVDHYAWSLVEKKERRIKMPTNICKRISFDCYLNAKAAKKKLYTCVGSTVDVRGNRLEEIPLDYSTYHLHWAEEEFEEIGFKIRRLYKIASVYLLHDIIQSLPEHNYQTVIWGLTRMIGREELMVDRFGHTRILREKDGAYYLDDNTSMPQNDTKRSFEGETFDDTINQYTRNLIIPAPQNFHSVTRNMERQIRSEIGDFRLFKQRWNFENSEIKMQFLERALLNDNIEPEIRNFILEDLRPDWIIMDSCVFHYYDQVRPRAAAGGYQGNFNKIKDDSSIRFFCKGEKTFRQAEGVALQRYVKIINDKLHVQKQAYMKKARDEELPFLAIFNRGSDGNFRFLIFAKLVYKTNGEIDGRHDRGAKINDITYQLLVEYAWILRIDNPIQTIVSPSRREAELRREVGEFFGQNVDDWSREKLLFYFNWMPSNLPASPQIDLEETFGEDLAFELSKFLAPHDFSYEAMLKRYIFAILKERDLMLIR